MLQYLNFRLWSIGLGNSLLHSTENLRMPILSRSNHTKILP